MRERRWDGVFVFGRAVYIDPYKFYRIVGYSLLILDWVMFSHYYNCFFLKNLKKIWRCIMFITAVVLINVFLHLYKGYFIRIIFFYICWFFIIYWLFSVFLFLFKKSQYTVFTRIVQRFWKRSLYLFWLLELALFFIYLFLTLISPQEYLFVDMVSLHYSYIFNLFSFFKNIFFVLILIFLVNLSLILWKYNTFRGLLQIFILFYFLIILQEDFIQFFYINQYYSNIVCVLDNDWDKEFQDVYLWNIECGNLKRRTLLHYFFILGFLKFWHTFFIVGFFLFFEVINIKTKHNSYNILASVLQNCYFLLLFTFILKIIFLKSYISYMYEYVYYWFFLNNHFYDYNALYYIFSLKYFFFFINDLF